METALATVAVGRIPPQQTDKAAIASLPLTVRSRIVAVVNSHDPVNGWEVVGYGLNGAASVPMYTPAEIRQSIDAIEATCHPAPDEVIDEEMTRCLLATVPRKENGETVTLRMGIFVERLSEFPADVVIHVLREWADTETFPPALANLVTRCRKEYGPRQSLLRELRRAVSAPKLVTSSVHP